MRAARGATPAVLACAVAAASAGALAGCGEFEVPSIVLDLRVLGATVDPPEVVTPFDPENIGDIELEDTTVCVLAADPADSRPLAYHMRACARTGSRRCDERDDSGALRPVVDMGGGQIEDPEQAATPQSMCAVLPADAALFPVLRDAIENSSISGFGGVRVMIELRVEPVGEPEQAQFAIKQMLYSPKLPEERVANRNPTLDELRATREDGTEIAMPIGRCNEVTPPEVRLDEALVFEPIEAEDTREDYVVPTFDGGSRAFTENIRYAYYATFGRWQRETTGGPRDLAGNEPPLDSEWTAERDEDRDGDIGDGVDVRMWVVQQDERGGLSWYETCVRVTP